MTLDRRRLFIYSAALITLSFAAYFVGGTFYVWWHIPEAYAAWDTGTLLVRYMQKNDGDWPKGWSDLEQLSHDEPQLRLRWNAHEPDYFDRMREMVAIDWEFDPITRTRELPITSVDGSPLVCLWSNPNGMINDYLDGLDSSIPDPLAN